MWISLSESSGPGNCSRSSKAIQHLGKSATSKQNDFGPSDGGYFTTTQGQGTVLNDRSATCPNTEGASSDIFFLPLNPIQRKFGIGKRLGSSMGTSRSPATHMPTARFVLTLSF